MNKEQIEKNEKIVQEAKNLIQKYKKEIETLKENDTFKDDKKIQTVCILREVCQDLELLMDIK